VCLCHICRTYETVVSCGPWSYSSPGTFPSMVSLDGFDPGWDSDQAESPNQDPNSVQSLSTASEEKSEEKPAWWRGWVTRWMVLPAPQSSRARRKRTLPADLWSALDAAVHLQNGEGSNTGKVSAKRSHEEILLAAIKRIRSFKVDTEGVVQVAMLQVPKEAALLVLSLPSCTIMHSGNGIDDLGRGWLCSDGLRGFHLTNLLHPDDAMQFKVFVGEILQAIKTAAPSRSAALASQVPTTSARSLGVRFLFCVAYAQKQDAPTRHTEKVFGACVRWARRSACGCSDRPRRRTHPEARRRAGRLSTRPS